MEGSEFDKKRIQFLSKALEEKKLEIQLVQMQNSSAASVSRGLASVNSDVQTSLAKIKRQDVDLSDFYFLRVKEFKQKKKYKEALAMIDKIKKSTANDENLARADYESIVIQCSNFKLNEICVDTLDNMVLQYPESEWTGQGLRWLSKSYSALNRKEEARKIEQILKADFAGLKVE